MPGRWGGPSQWFAIELPVALGELGLGGQSRSGTQPGHREASHNVPQKATFLGPLPLDKPIEKAGGKGIAGAGGIHYLGASPLGLNEICLLATQDVTGRGCSPLSPASHGDDDGVAALLQQTPGPGGEVLARQLPQLIPVDEENVRPFKYRGQGLKPPGGVERSGGEADLDDDGVLMIGELTRYFVQRFYEEIPPPVSSSEGYQELVFSRGTVMQGTVLFWDEISDGKLDSHKGRIY